LKFEWLKKIYEKYHDITYTDKAIKAAAVMSEKYITNRQLPDKAIDLVDEAGAKKHLSLIYIPQRYEYSKKKNKMLSQKEIKHLRVIISKNQRNCNNK
jgi:ATP-dependent Clp protease ATP-binding subunit ClpA